MIEYDSFKPVNRTDNVSWRPQRKILFAKNNRFSFNPAHQTIIKLDSKPVSNEGLALWDLITNFTVSEVETLKKVRDGINEI